MEFTKDEEKVLLLGIINKLVADQRVTVWEREFLESISKQMTSKDLTEKQMIVLSKIRQKYGSR